MLHSAQILPLVLFLGMKESGILSRVVNNRVTSRSDGSRRCIMMEATEEQKMLLASTLIVISVINNV
jgi:hypothetical protein